MLYVFLSGGSRKADEQRPSKADPDAPGSWKHDLHQAPSSSLADRLSGSSRGSVSGSGSGAGSGSLLSRISGGQGQGRGKELLPAQGNKANSNSNKGKELFGFSQTPPVNPTNPNAGLELLSSSNSRPSTGPTRTRTPRGFQAEEGARSLAQSGVNAALGLASRERRRVETSRGGGVSILGAGRQTILVRVANLAQGTTAEDVVVSLQGDSSGVDWYHI